MHTATCNWQLSDFGIQCWDGGLYYQYASSDTATTTQHYAVSALASSNYRNIGGPSNYFELRLFSNGAKMYFNGNEISGANAPGTFGRSPGSDEVFNFGCAVYDANDGISDVAYLDASGSPIPLHSGASNT